MDVAWREVSSGWKKESREKLEELMNERVKGWQGMDDNVKVTVVMDRACRDEDVEGQWRECGRGILQHMGPIPQETDIYR